MTVAAAWTPAVRPQACAKGRADAADLARNRNPRILGSHLVSAAYRGCLNTGSLPDPGRGSTAGHRIAQAPVENFASPQWKTLIGIRLLGVRQESDDPRRASRSVTEVAMMTLSRKASSPRPTSTDGWEGGTTLVTPTAQDLHCQLPLQVK